MADGEQVSGSNGDETLKADPQASSPPSPWAPPVRPPEAPVWVTPPSPWAQPAGPQAGQTTPAPTAGGWPQADPTRQRTAPGQWPAPQAWGQPAAWPDGPQRRGVAAPPPGPGRRRRNLIIGVACGVVVAIAAVTLAVTLGGSGRSGAVPAAFLGSWNSDTITETGQDGTQEGQIQIRVKIMGGSVGKVVGTATYGCGTQQLLLLGTDSGALYVEEQSPPCGQSVVKITRAGSGQLNYTYDPTYRPDLSDGGDGGGVLTKGSGTPITSDQTDSQTEGRTT